MTNKDKTGGSGGRPGGAPTEEKSRDETEPVRPVSTERQKLIDNPNLNQAGNDRGSHDEPETGSQTGADID